MTSPRPDSVRRPTPTSVPDRRTHPTRSPGSSSTSASRPGVTVVDLAAGTGKLTRLLAPAGADLLAVEPVAGMAHLLHEALPVVPLTSSTAEAMPFASGSLDAVTVAQAFHWFDADRAFAELHRVLRPRGRLGLVWNARDRSVDWVDQVWSIMDRVEKRAPWRAHDQWHDSALGDRTGFGPLHARDVPPRAAGDTGRRRRARPLGQPRRGAPATRPGARARRGPGPPRHASRHPRTRRPRDPVPGRRVLVRTAVTSGATSSSRTRAAVAAGRAAGWASRVTGRGAGATISGRVMLRVAPDLLAELARDRPRHAGVGDQRQDDHHRAASPPRSAPADGP